jgi:flagellar motor switch protein FliG
MATPAQAAIAGPRPSEGRLVVQGDAAERELDGDEKAAAILLALGPDYGKAIFEELDEIEIRQLSSAMVRIGPITQNMLDELLVDFVTRLSSNTNLAGTPDSTERLLLSFLPKERVDFIMEEIRGPAGRTIWEKLSNVQEDVLANFLKNEYPQTAAVVLSKLSPDHASRVLANLPEALSMECVLRMLAIEPVQKDVLDKIESTLRTEFVSTLSPSRLRDSYEQMAEIFNSFDRQTETRFIASLEEIDRDAAERIKALMFTFDDMAALESAAIQTILQSVEKSDLALALKGASEATRDFFFSNMSARASKMLREDMDTMGPVRLKDVDEAQSRLLNTAKDLAARGDIVITKNRGDEEMIG